MRSALTIQVYVPMQLYSRTNGSRSRAHWSRISEAARNQRAWTTLAWMNAGRPTWSGPAVVTFTARVARLWDDDNLPPALKAIRDEAVFRILGTDDGPACGHSFVYEQEVRPAGERGVLIQVTPKET